jgi:hypothetical protein
MNNAFTNVPQAYYKHLSGEYYTARHLTVVRAKIIKTQHPAIVKVNTVEKLAYKKDCTVQSIQRN